MNYLSKWLFHTNYNYLSYMFHNFWDSLLGFPTNVEIKLPILFLNIVFLILRVSVL